MTARRTRSDSVKGMVDAMAAAIEGDIDPPGHVRLRDGDRPFWAAVVRARARAEWTDADLVHAANMARAMADIERLQLEIEGEGDVLTNARGTVVANPKHAILEQLSRRVMALTRLLQMQAAASGDLEDKTKRRKAESEARKVARQLEDDLIPTA